MATPGDVLAFWFEEPARTDEDHRRKIKRWFNGGPAMDEVIRERFGREVELALEGKLDDWADTAAGTMALVLLLDQFTRGIYRDTARAFAGDARAQASAARAFDNGTDRELDWPEKMFLAMPFLHAENDALQSRAVATMERLQQEAPAEHKMMFAGAVEQARKYQDIIRRFGRFPHRNGFLGRESTPEEVEFLKDWATKAAPSTVKDKP